MNAAAKTKSVEMKTAGKAVLKSGKRTVVKKVKPAAKKSEPVVSKTAAKQKVGKTAPKNLTKKTKNQKAKRVVSDKNSKPAKKAKPVVSTRKTNKIGKKIESLISSKTVKTPPKKTETKATKIKTLKTKKAVSPEKIVLDGKKKRVIAKAKVNQKPKQTKQKALTKTINSPKTNPTVSTKKVKTVKGKIRSAAVSAKAKTKIQKPKQTIAVKKTRAVKEKPTQRFAVQPAKLKKQAAKPVISGKKVESAKTKTKSAGKKFDVKNGKETKPNVAAKNTKAAKKKAGAIVRAPKTHLRKTDSIVLPKNLKAIENKNGKWLEEKVKLVGLSPRKEEKKKKIKPISSAVFRGKKDRYDFKVFSIKEKIENVPAIYIISRRKTDKNNRGHHALVCIGQADSISDEIKRHQKSKCVKKYDANVISILPEENEKKRLKIETDLRAAHTIACKLR